MNIVTIYTISCPITEQIKYVGKTISPLRIRLQQHMALPTNAKMKYWMESLNGKSPVIEQIDETDLCHADEVEMYWIEQFRAWGIPLLNVSRNYVKNEQITLCLSTNLYEFLKHFIEQRPHLTMEKAIIRAAETGFEMIEELESDHARSEGKLILKYYTKQVRTYYTDFSSNEYDGYELPF